jgi:hypothetical protein
MEHANSIEVFKYADVRSLQPLVGFALYNADKTLIDTIMSVEDMAKHGINREELLPLFKWTEYFKIRCMTELKKPQSSHQITVHGRSG